MSFLDEDLLEDVEVFESCPCDSKAGSDYMDYVPEFFHFFFPIDIGLWATKAWDWEPKNKLSYDILVFSHVKFSQNTSSEGIMNAIPKASMVE